VCQAQGSKKRKFLPEIVMGGELLEHRSDEGFSLFYDIFVMV
jgi:hypothetical protein